METEELIKLVDGIYKNILDKFNPGARQMINAGKAYLKALHGAAAASRLYVDAISRLAQQAQQGTWGGSSDIGSALMKIVEVYKETQDQQMNILKAFYVDLLVPLETNLEKDTKVVQSEQKKFLQQHKQRTETYSKAVAMMKKQRKKSRSNTKTGLAVDKELKNMQVLEEEKTKLDAFCEQSLKNAMTQERRRYGFVLERQCSLAKHHLSLHSQGVAAYQQNIENWSEIAKTREFLPDSVENIFTSRLRNVSVWQDDEVYANPRSPNFEEDRVSLSSQLRKTKSMDASCLDIRSIGDAGSPVTTFSRAKSEYNLNSSTQSLVQGGRRPKSIAVPPPPQWDTQLAKSLYAYLSSGENQLSFLEGDLIALIGERNKGWQFGENLRTQCSGWFPLAYTELLDEDNLFSDHKTEPESLQLYADETTRTQKTADSNDVPHPSSGKSTIEKSKSRMFGDASHSLRATHYAMQDRQYTGFNRIPPPQLPAPVPTSSLPYQKTGLRQSVNMKFTEKSAVESDQRDAKTSSKNYSTHSQPSKFDRPLTSDTSLPLHLRTKGGIKGGPSVVNASLHSSNDSGFINDPPPQPEVDYSDDDSIMEQPNSKNRKSRSRPDLNVDSNNNSKFVRGSTLRYSQGQASMTGKRQYIGSDPDILKGKEKHLVKRTKSFWRFGRNNDTEILEGMALWKHRDLVDVEDSEKDNIKKSPQQKKAAKPRDCSTDSDRTISNERKSGTIKRNELSSKRSNSEHDLDLKSLSSITLRNELPPEVSTRSNFIKKNLENDENLFYDDGDGLMMKTVNRKNILQQYNESDLTDMNSEISDSDITTECPYDSILIDQRIEENSETVPNVAKIGRKLEKLSKLSKFSPSREKEVDNNLRRNTKDTTNNRHYREHNEEQDSTLNRTRYRDNQYNFETFRPPQDRIKQIEKNNSPSNQQYNKDGANKNHKQKKRQVHATDTKHNTENRAGSEIGNELKRSDAHESRKENTFMEMKYVQHKKKEIGSDRNRYSDSINDDSETERQFISNSKLNRKNNDADDYEDFDLMRYGETLQRRLRNSEYKIQYENRSGHNGNMYGPWYDLWGLDATAKNDK